MTIFGVHAFGVEPFAGRGQPGVAPPSPTPLVLTKITWFPSSGPSLVFEPTDYSVERWAGFDAVPLWIQTMSSPFQRGGSLVDVRMETRAPRIEGLIVNDTEGELLDEQRDLIRGMSPEKGMGTLRMHVDESVFYDIDALPVETVFSNHRWPLVTPAAVDFFAPFPLFYQAQLSKVLGAGAGAMAVINAGDTVAPMSLVFNGPSVNPKVTDTGTGEYIRLKRTLIFGETYTVHTGWHQTSVSRNLGGVVSRAEQFLEGNRSLRLQVGTNNLTYTEEGGGSPGQVYITYHDWFLGVK